MRRGVILLSRCAELLAQEYVLGNFIVDLKKKKMRMLMPKPSYKDSVGKFGSINSSPRMKRTNWRQDLVALHCSGARDRSAWQNFPGNNNRNNATIRQAYGASRG